MAPIPILALFKQKRNKAADDLPPASKMDPTLRAAWWCSQCKTQNFFQVRPGNNPLGKCTCKKCGHIPCEDCNFTGQVKHFVPIQDPIAVAHPGADGRGRRGKKKEIPYGIICAGCGQSWRAEEVKGSRKDRWKGKLPKKAHVQEYLQGDHKAKYLPGPGVARVMPHHKPAASSQALDDTPSPPPQGNYPYQNRPQKAQSMINLISAAQHITLRQQLVHTPDSRRSVTDPSANSSTPNSELEEVELVQSMTVRFSGVKCTCGCVSLLSGSSIPFLNELHHARSHSHANLLSVRSAQPRSSYTFQLVLPEPTAKTSPTAGKGDRKISTPLRPLSIYEYETAHGLAEPQWLMDKGHGEKILRMGPSGKLLHPNPLMSNKVNPMDFTNLNVDDGWEDDAGAVGCMHEGEQFLRETPDDGERGHE